ncbi:MAG: DUF1501 domain-containing protein, partial [Planctomycetaceae bacterium]|nr:DUF1501 domain-containing protein [Planctomycetaceae bacterium]
MSPSTANLNPSSPQLSGRRAFLGGSLLGSLASLGYAQRATAAPAARKPQQVLFLWLAGGSSQFETWDPKPGRATGGPFQAIGTNLPGVQVCELMPRLARRMDRLAVIRSLSTPITEHFMAADLISTGRPKEPALVYPELGVVLAHELSTGRSLLPDYVSIFRTTEGRRRAEPGFLGAAHGALHLEQSLLPENVTPPAGLSPQLGTARDQLRHQIGQAFLAGRAGRDLGDSYELAQRRVQGLTAAAPIFDLAREPQRVQDRYGRTPFGRHCLLARRLLESGVPVVKVARGFWDSHHDNFESHRELVTDFDRVFSVLLDDLSERGLLDTTLVIVLSEFGRTPKINKDVGRDHYAAAWSAVLAGAGIQPGVVHGRTDRDGVEVVDGKVSVG